MNWKLTFSAWQSAQWKQKKQKYGTQKAREGIPCFLSALIIPEKNHHDHVSNRCWQHLVLSTNANIKYTHRKICKWVPRQFTTIVSHKNTFDWAAKPISVHHFESFIAIFFLLRNGSGDNFTRSYLRQWCCIPKQCNFHGNYRHRERGRERERRKRASIWDSRNMSLATAWPLTGVYESARVCCLQNSAYDLKDGADAWRSLAHPTPCYPYDPTGMGGYPYGQRYALFCSAKNITEKARNCDYSMPGTLTLLLFWFSQFPVNSCLFNCQTEQKIKFLQFSKR